MKSILNRRNFFAVLVALMVMCITAGVANCGTYSGGTGEPNNPYIIATAEDLNDIGNNPSDWDKHFMLAADINLADYTGTQFNIIGDFGHPFMGVVDGNNHMVSNFSWSASSYVGCIGLFGVVGDNDEFHGEVRDLRMANVDVNVATSSDFVGALVGYNNGGLISGCSVSGGILGSGNIGGLIGYNDGGTIINCHSAVNVSGNRYGVGGLVGIDSGGEEIAFCSATGNVSGEDDFVGGLVGSAGYTHIYNCFASGDVVSTGNRYATGGLVGDSTGCAMENCYATGNVTGNEEVGGLFGNYYSSTAQIVNSYASGRVTGNDYVGAFIGYGMYNIDCQACFWDSNINPDVNGIGNGSDPNVIGESTTNMQTESTFTDAGWDFVGEVINGPNDVWTICEGEDYPMLAWEKYGGGNGTEANPYLIRTSCQMNAIGADSNDWGKDFKLMADIDLGGYTGTSFNIIGIYIKYNDPNNRPFTGVFDGGGHTISNFTYNSNGVGNIGLFGWIDDPNAEVKNLGLINPYVNSEWGNSVGALVGGLRQGRISGCFVEGGSVSGGFFVGGLVGDNMYGSISDSYSTGEVAGEERAGGLVGYNYSGDISSCYSTCSVIGVDGVGGLVGSNGYGSSISNSYSEGIVTGLVHIGGLVGYNEGGNITSCYSTCSVTGIYHVGGLVGSNYEGDISSCYSTDEVAGEKWVGGLVGSNYSGDISSCYSTCSVTGIDRVGGLVGYANSDYVIDSFWDVNSSGIDTSDGGTGLPTVEMQTESTFTDAGWDFVGEVINGPNDIWDICEGTNYPKLAWHIPLPGDFVCPDGVEMIDFSILGLAWLSSSGQPNWNPVCDISEPNDNFIDELDLKVFTDNWLAGL